MCSPGGQSAWIWSPSNVASRSRTTCSVTPSSSAISTGHRDQPATSCRLSKLTRKRATSRHTCRSMAGAWQPLWPCWIWIASCARKHRRSIAVRFGSIHMCRPSVAATMSGYGRFQMIMTCASERNIPHTFCISRTYVRLNV